MIIINGVNYGTGTNITISNGKAIINGNDVRAQSGDKGNANTMSGDIEYKR
jgi:hypothetical protein